MIESKDAYDETPVTVEWFKEEIGGGSNTIEDYPLSIYAFGQKRISVDLDVMGDGGGGDFSPDNIATFTTRGEVRRACELFKIGPYKE